MVAKAWVTWRDKAARFRAERALLRRSVMRQVLAALAAALATWRGVVGERWERLQLVRTGVMREHGGEDESQGWLVGTRMDGRATLRLDHLEEAV